MAIYKIFEGGNQSNRQTNQMLPSGTSPAACNPPYGYAEHLRERSYGITRRLDLRSRSPSKEGGMDQALVCFVKDNVLAVGDVLETHLLLPNTVLKALSFGVIGAVPGLTFDVKIIERSTPVAAIAALPVVVSIDAGVAPTNVNGCPLAAYLPVAAGAGQFIDEESYAALVITALPVGGLTSGCGPGGLNMWVTGHVLDLDHGNA